MKKAFIGLSLIALFGIVSLASADHSWGDYHWGRTTPAFSLKLGDNVTRAWDGYLTAASADWTKSSVIDTSVVAGNTSATRGRNTPQACVPTQGRAEICNAKYGATGWLGIATIWVSGSHITAGTVKLNDTYFNTTAYNKPAWRALVMCQEVGHLFGLGHQDETFANANIGTCTDYTNSPDANQHPNAHDYEMLASIYAPLDTTTTVGQSAATSRLQDDTNDSSEWGREVRRSRDGRSSVFEADAGRGNKVLRYVYWVEPQDESHDHSGHQH
jgi:hypothetical protein